MEDLSVSPFGASDFLMEANKYLRNERERKIKIGMKDGRKQGRKERKRKVVDAQPVRAG